MATPLKGLLKLMHDSRMGGALLIGSAVLSIFLVNSSFASTFHHLLESQLGISFGSNVFSKSLHHWINDGLMAIFFFVVGLELKREIIAGELSDIRKAMLPVAAAIGGMVVPALIYICFSWHHVI